MNEETRRILQNGSYKRERTKKHDISANLQRSDLADSLPRVTFKPSGSILNAVEGLAEGMRQLATSGELTFHGNPAAENAFVELYNFAQGHLLQPLKQRGKTFLHQRGRRRLLLDAYAMHFLH